MEFVGSIVSDRNVDGMVEMMIDATQNCFKPLTTDKLFYWHAAFFPMGRSGIFKITATNHTFSITIKLYISNICNNPCIS